MKITTHKKFDKAFVKLTSEQRTSIKQAIAAFESNRLDPNLRDHALKGKMKRLRAFSAGWDLRVILKTANERESTRIKTLKSTYCTGERPPPIGLTRMSL